jgi:hypothetical protein
VNEWNEAFGIEPRKLVEASAVAELLEPRNASAYARSPCARSYLTPMFEPRTSTSVHA